jgi:hypothetical protein
VQKYSKAIINLDGNSSRIQDRKNVERNIAEALIALNIPYEFYKSKRKGFKVLMEDMNQEGVIYILNDSLQFHLCEKPHILISRSISWVQSSVKPSTIGRLTQEMIALNSTELIATIARSTPMRQEYDEKRATTYLLFNDYAETTTDSFGRNGGAAMSWMVCGANDIHLELLPYEEEGRAKVNEMLKVGLEKCTHPDDILIMTNRDICLVPEATGLIRTFMDNRNIDACFVQRVDTEYSKPPCFNDLVGLPQYSGIDIFCFRPSYKELPRLLELDLWIGAELWDAYYASIIKCRLPYSVAAHWPHIGEWQKGPDERNMFNRMQVASVDSDVIVSGMNGMAWYDRKY